MPFVCYLHIYPIHLQVHADNKLQRHVNVTVIQMIIRLNNNPKTALDLQLIELMHRTNDLSVQADRGHILLVHNLISSYRTLLL